MCLQSPEASWNLHRSHKGVDLCSTGDRQKVSAHVTVVGHPMSPYTFHKLQIDDGGHKREEDGRMLWHPC